MCETKLTVKYDDGSHRIVIDREWNGALVVTKFVQK
jgi:hypothetical protein